MLFLCTEFLAVLIIYTIEQFSHNLHIIPYLFWIPTSFNYLDTFPATTLLNTTYLNLILYTIIALVTTLPIWKNIHDVETIKQSPVN